MGESKRRRSKPLRFIAVPLPDEHPCWPALDRQVPPDHLARRVRSLVETLDLDSLLETYTGVGAPLHPPDRMLAFVLFESQRGRRSPAQWFLDARESIPARWLLRGLRPARAVCYRFRDHLPADLVDWLNRQVLLLAQAEGHTTADNGALDGTFTAAYGSRHHLLNRNSLDHRLHLLDEAIAADDATAADATAEPTRLPDPTTQPLPSPEQTTASGQATDGGAGQLSPATRPYWMARSAAGRCRQRGRYQHAQQILQVRLRHHEQRQKGKSARRRKSSDKVVICPNDPEAVLGKDKCKVFRPLFNTQILQDVESPFVLGYQVCAQVSDSGLLATMLARTHQLTGRHMKKVRTDGIYASLKDVRYCKENGVELYAPVARGSVTDKETGGRQEQGPGGAVGKGRRGRRKAKRFGKEQFHWEKEQQTYRCPQGHLLQLGRIRQKEREHGEYVEVAEYRCSKEYCQNCPQSKDCTSQPEKGRTVERMVGQELLDEVAALLRTAAGQKEYQKRKQTVELRHGDMRSHRELKYFHSYGQEGAASQVGLLILSHNGLALLKAREQRKCAQASASTAPTPAHLPPAIPLLQNDEEWATWN